MERSRLSVLKSPLPAAHGESAGREVRATVLLVEDDDQLRDAIEENLRHLGYAVIPVPNGYKALQLARLGIKFDLLLTDIRMPGEIDGARLAAEIHMLRPDVVVVFSTGCVEEEIGTSKRLDRQNAYLIKPYTLKQMEATLAAAAMRATKSQRLR